MSFYFNVNSVKKVSFRELKDNLNNPDIKFHWEPEDYSNFIEGTKIYIPHKSTRGITISKEENSYSIGINVIASEEDFKLAIDVSAKIAEITGSKIIPEDEDEELNAITLKSKYNQTWIDSMKTLGANIFMEKIGNEGGLLSIGCCYMRYTVGPNIHSKLDTSNELNYYNSLVEHIQKSQFFDLSKYQIPQILVSTNKDGTNRKTYVVFYPHGSQFLSTADYVIFPVDNRKYEIPYGFIPLIADSKFSLIDETQFTIQPLNENDYKAIIERIESELSKVSQEKIVENYKKFTDEELDDEFNRIASIPNARIKLFALQRMSKLISEYEHRNIPMPNTEERIKPNHQQNQLSIQQEDKNIKPQRPWWKFW